MRSEEFWRRLRGGVEVAVAGTAPELLLGVRDAFLRYLQHDGADGGAVVVVPHPVQAPPRGLLLSDEDMVRTAIERARALGEEGGRSYPFCVACEGGLEGVGEGEARRLFVRSWCAVISPLGESVGGSGSLQLPPRLVDELAAGQAPDHLPGTRRRGGLLASLTGGVESRRSAVALATFHAVATHFYDAMGGRP